MLFRSDRGFYSWGLWHAAAGAGAGLLWRVTASLRLRPLAELPDGSWLAHVDDPRAVAARHHRNGMRRRRGSGLPPDAGPLPGMTVRVVEYRLTVTADDGTARTERYRLVTTLLDHRAYPAAALAGAYARRWAIEVGHRWCLSSRAAFSWLCSLFLVGLVFWLCPAGPGVVAGRACPALA